MQRPFARIDCVEGDRQVAAGRYQHGVAQRAGDPLPVDRDDLETVTVQMHRVRHAAAVGEGDFDPLALAHP
ncbi:hypothetical protein D3C80_2174760 [compost metagenome]